jgi:hypothetical protein
MIHNLMVMDQSTRTRWWREAADLTPQLGSARRQDIGDRLVENGDAAVDLFGADRERRGDASNLPVCISASLSAASLASPPVERNIAFDRDGGSIEVRRRDSSTTGGLSMPLNRCSAPVQAFSIASTMRG